MLFSLFAALVYICLYMYIFRVKAFIQYGWADGVVDPDDVSTTSDEGMGHQKLIIGWTLRNSIGHLMMCPDLPMLKSLPTL